jgi:hypothetical protein
MNSEKAANLVSQFLYFYIVPALIGAFVLLCFISQDFRESWFGPDYYNRSTPAYHGQRSRWSW